jgi:lipoprotein signal peptidase
MAIIFFIFIYDLFLKKLADKPIDHNYIAIYPTKNSGAGISLLHGHNTLLLVLNIISLFLIFVLYNWHPSPYLFLVIGGVAGNLYDRYVYGGVRDFLYFKHFFVCNFADICIFLGFLCFYLSRAHNPQLPNWKIDG